MTRFWDTIRTFDRQVALISEEGKPYTYRELDDLVDANGKWVKQGAEQVDDILQKQFQADQIESFRQTYKRDPTYRDMRGVNWLGSGRGGGYDEFMQEYKNNPNMSLEELFKKYKNLRPNLEHNSEQFRISQTDKSGKRTYGRFRTLQEQYDLMGSQAEVNPKYEDTNATMARAKEKMEKNPYLL